jgi:peroxiredoxin
VARHRDRLAAAGISVLVVAQAEPKNVAWWTAKHPQPFPIVSDHNRTAYRAFGLGRVSWLHFIRPDVLLGYLWVIVRGWRVRKPVRGEDVLQLGGDFVLDRDRRLVFAYPSRAATDRPSAEQILAAVTRRRSTAV